MRPFDYLEPESLAEACSLLSKHNGEAKIIAGGQSLLPLLKQRLMAPKYVININGLAELDCIVAAERGITIGALTTHRALETSSVIKEHFPVLARMETLVASVQVRNWGTVGGNLCHAEPGGDPATALTALRAKVKATSERGTREIPLDDFFVDYLESALEPDEILVEIEVPYLTPQTGTAFVKEAVRAGDYPIVSAAAVVTLVGEVVKEASIVLGSVGKTPLRAKNTESWITGRKLTPQDWEDVGKLVAEEIEPSSDVVASAAYKRELAKFVTKKAVSQAVGLARQ